MRCRMISMAWMRFHDDIDATIFVLTFYISIVVDNGTWM